MADVRIVRAGAPIGGARAAILLIHGRGADAQGMLQLGHALGSPDVAYVAPEAPGHTWYPQSFLAPLNLNQPYLQRALDLIGRTVEQIEAEGVAREKIVLVGFSQGACLALEFAARNARRYGAIAGFSGGLIGPEGTARDYPGSLSGTPVFLGCSDVDFHIPVARVHETAEVMRKLGGDVTEIIYPGMAHTIVEDEVKRVRGIVASIAATASAQG